MTSAAEAIDLWRFRARAERQAAARFEQLADDHRRLGGHPAVQALIERAIEDEHRHAELCVGLARTLGGSGQTPPPVPRPQTPTLGELDPQTVFTIQVVGMCALNETISAAVLAEMLKRARDGPAHATIRAILKDEIDHARIGWAHLEDMKARALLEPKTIARAMPRLLREAVRDELFEPDPQREAATAPEQLGGLDRATRLTLFVEAIEGLVIPGLDRIGVPSTSTKNWLEAARSRP